MSGIEVAGLVLGALPLIIQGVLQSNLKEKTNRLTIL
jgi:hypothetical protein